MKDWTFGRRLAAGFTVVVVLSLIMGAVAFSALRDVVASKDAVIEQNSENLVDAQRIRTSTWEKVALMRSYILTGSPEYVAEIELVDQRLTLLIQEMRHRGLSADQIRLVDEIERARTAHDQAGELVFARMRAADPLEDVLAAFDQRMTPAFRDVERRVDDFVATEARVLAERKERASANARRASTTVLVIAAAVGALAALLGFLLTRSVTHQVGSAVQQVRSSSAELRTTAAQQAAGVKEQATAMSQVSTTINELLASSRQIADSARRVAELTREVEDSARDGGETVGLAREAVAGIRKDVDVIVQHMLDLGRRSQQIGGIIDIITELAEQTNILAINATIEAAGAGEAGRRFSVVGDEIRKLADRVGGSTKEIRELIDEIRGAVNATVMSTESGSKTVDQGISRFDGLTVAFERIGEIVETASEAAREIELSTKQQTTAVEQVNVAVSSVAQATRETEVGATQTAQTAAEMLSLSGELARLVRAPSA